MGVARTEREERRAWEMHIFTGANSAHVAVWQATCRRGGDGSQSMAPFNVPIWATLDVARVAVGEVGGSQRVSPD